MTIILYAALLASPQRVIIVVRSLSLCFRWVYGEVVTLKFCVMDGTS